MKIIISIFALCFLLSSCTNPTKVENTLDVVNIPTRQIPTAVVQAITEKFPGALPYEVAIDSIVKHLENLGIPTNTILWGQSTCVDDIINTKDKFVHPEIKGPFSFGGLAGLPFTGVSGLSAFAHHIPEEGTALISVGPHIGYNENAGWGSILRHDQHHVSSCCGALVGALTKLQHGELKQQIPSVGDYQEGILEQLAYEHRDEILSSPEPIIAFTKLTYQEAAKQISEHAAKITERHFKYAVIIGCIIINTDYEYPDYLRIEHISILDIQKNEWIEGGTLVEK